MLSLNIVKITMASYDSACSLGDAACFTGGRIAEKCVIVYKTGHTYLFEAICKLR